jgi:hypothetical protein
VVTPAGSVRQCNILGNGTFAFYVSSPNNPNTVIEATDNWWGVGDSAAIELLIYHQDDNAAHPLVDYVPFAKEPFGTSNLTPPDSSALSPDGK